MSAAAHERIFAIGDIHGHSKALDALMAALPLRSEDHLVFLGDYVDKGPDVKGVLDRLVKLSSRPRTVFLRGNHDQMLLDARDPVKFAIWECLAGDDPLTGYGEGAPADILREIPSSHWHFLETTCVDFLEHGAFIFVHAGIRPDSKPEEEDQERLHWQTLGMALPHSSGKTVVCGHSAQQSFRIADLGHTVCVDTGITKGGFLTCLELHSRQAWQSDAAGMLKLP